MTDQFKQVSSGNDTHITCGHIDTVLGDKRQTSEQIAMLRLRGSSFTLVSEALYGGYFVAREGSL